MHSIDFAADLVSLNQRRPGKPVPFDDVAAAYTAGVNLDEHLTGTGFRFRDLLQPDVFIVVPDGYFHSLSFRFQVSCVKFP